MCLRTSNRYKAGRGLQTHVSCRVHDILISSWTPVISLFCRRHPAQFRGDLIILFIILFNTIYAIYRHTRTRITSDLFIYNEYSECRSTIIYNPQYIIFRRKRRGRIGWGFEYNGYASSLATRKPFANIKILSVY